MAADPAASRRIGPPLSAAEGGVRSLGGPAGAEFVCPRRARLALSGHVDVSERHAAVAVLVAVAALARHVPASGAGLARRDVPTTLGRLGDLALVRGARLDGALHALSAAGLVTWGETGAGLSAAVTEAACAPHPTLAAVPWEAVTARLAAGVSRGERADPASGWSGRRPPDRTGRSSGTPRTSAFALLLELALLAESSLSTAAVAGALATGPLALGPGNGTERTPYTPRLAADFTSLARELGYHRSRLTPAVHALDALGLVRWDAEPGLRGTVQVAPWVLGLAPVPDDGAPPIVPTGAAADAGGTRVSTGITLGVAAAAPESAGRAAVGAPQCVLLGPTPIYVAPGTPLDFSARTPDGRPALRFVVNGVEIVLPLDGAPPK